MNKLELIILIVAMILFFIGTLKIHLAVRSKSSFLMLLAFVLFIVFGIGYLVAFTMTTFWYDNSPEFLFHLMNPIDTITDFIVLLGAIGFYGLSRSFVKE